MRMTFLYFVRKNKLLNLWIFKIFISTRLIHATDIEDGIARHN
jgi:hypothetical protein